MSFEERFNQIVSEAENFVIDSEFDKIDLLQVGVFYTFNNGEEYLITSIERKGRYLDVNLDNEDYQPDFRNLDEFTKVCIADEIKRQLG